MEKRIAVYLRVSTDAQNTDLQKHDIEKYVENKGWTSVVFYSDKVSGTTTNRTGLQAMLREIRLRKVDVVICWKLDRLFRSLKDLVSTLNEFSELGIDFISIKDNIDMTTASGRLLAHLLGAIGQFEAELIRMRVNAGLADAKKKGIRLGRPSFLPHEDVRILRSQGLSLSQIAKRLKISKSSVHKSLHCNAVQKSSIKFESTQIQKPDLSDHKTIVKRTDDELPRPMVECHEEAKECHEKDYSVTADTKGFSE
jgi:putative DNA-invertase from lambdoid prophage Rac